MRQGAKRASAIVAAICLLILGALAFAAINQIREAKRQITLANTIRQTCLATFNYESAHQCFPKASQSCVINGQEYSWATVLLPFQESSPIFSQINMNRPWNDLLNVPYVSKPLPYYVSPHESVEKDANGFGLNHFSANSDVFVLDGEPRKLDDDPKSNQVMIGEVCDGYLAWAAPGNARDIENGIKFDTRSFGSPVRPGATFGYVDGSVHFVSSDNERPSIRIVDSQEKAKSANVIVNASLLKNLPCTVHLVGPNGEAFVSFVQDDPERQYSKTTFYEIGPGIPDHWLETLKKVNHVIGVSFCKNPVSKNGIRILGEMTDLQALELGGGFQITDEDLKQLYGLENLKVLSMLDDRITEEGLAGLKTALPDCEVIDAPYLDLR
jgi:hypothetical protein